MRRSGVWIKGRYYWHQHFEGLNDLVKFFDGLARESDRVKGSGKFVLTDKVIGDMTKERKGVIHPSHQAEIDNSKKQRQQIITNNFPGTEAQARKLEKFTIECEELVLKNFQDFDIDVEDNQLYGARLNVSRVIAGDERPYERVVEPEEALQGVGRNVIVWVNSEMLMGMSHDNLFWLVASGLAMAKVLRKFGYNVAFNGYTLGYSGHCDAMQTYEVTPFGEEFDYKKIVALAIRPSFLSDIWNGYLECPEWKCQGPGGGRSLRPDEKSLYGMEKDVVLMTEHGDYHKMTAQKAAETVGKNLERYIQK